MPDAAPTTLDPHQGEVVVGPLPHGGGTVVLRWHRRGDTAEIELDTDGGSPAPPADSGSGSGEPVDPRTVGAVADGVGEVVRALDGATVHLAAEHPADRRDDLAEAVADATGFPVRRDLLQLRRPLPVPGDHPARRRGPAATPRAFRPGVDDDAWLRVNNRAFAHHPDQGRETRATLADRTAEAWFDPADFLLVDDPARPGELAGSCWTRVHPPTADDPALGEIYVIGVDPARAGEGLGAPLVLAGLDHLAARGLTTAVLYVDADNAPARRLYDRLGFTVHRRRRVYTPAPGGTR